MFSTERLQPEQNGLRDTTKVFCTLMGLFAPMAIGTSFGWGGHRLPTLILELRLL